MKKYSYLLILFWGMSVYSVAQNVTVEASIDSVQIYIGEQAKLKLEVTADSDQPIVFPHFPDTLVRGIEVLEALKPDTQYLNDGQRRLIAQEYIITSFDSALYFIPPIPILVNEIEYNSNALALKVETFQVDTSNPDQFFGLKPVMKPPFMWSDWIGLIILSFVSIPLLVLLIYLIVRLRDNKPIIRRIKVEPKIPPHILAMEEIERIKNENKAYKADPKVYYTELTDVIRNYLNGRFGFNALEMTSSEIIDKLNQLGETEDINDLRELFQTADLVKFAKHNPMINENDANLINAIEFINETKVKDEENQKPQPTEITIIEKRPLRSKIILLTGIILLSAGILASFIYIVMRVLYLRG